MNTSEQSSNGFDISALAGGTNASGGAATGTNGDPNDPVNLLVGEGKKFKTVQDLAKGKLASDDHIARLQEENNRLREGLLGEANNGADPKALIAELTKLVNSRNAATGRATTNEDDGTNQSRATAPLSKEQLYALLDERETAVRTNSNITLFNSTVSKLLGDKAEEVVSSKLGEIGMDAEVFSVQVAKNPEAALKLLGLAKAPAASGTEAREGSVNTEAFFAMGSGGAAKENHAYFSKLRRDKPSEFYSAPVQQRMLDARKKLGDEYWK